VHDYFDILGVPPDAGAQQIRRARHRRLRVGHPDVHDGDPQPLDPAPAMAVDAADLTDAAIDFVEMTAIVDRMRAAFFTAS
jgi:curved DNA-binding protein CbpA